MGPERYNTVCRAFVLQMTYPCSIPGIQYGLYSPPEIIPERRDKK